MANLVYDSFEKFSYARYAKISPAAEPSRDHVTVEARQLKRICKVLGISLANFKTPNGKRYKMTQEVVDFFDYLLDKFEDNNHENLRKKDLLAISESDRVTVHERLYHALTSLKIDNCIVQHQLISYEIKAKSSLDSEYIPPSALTLEAIDYWREICPLTEVEYYSFAKELEYDYRYLLRVAFFEFCKDRLRDFVKKIDPTRDVEDLPYLPSNVIKDENIRNIRKDDKDDLVKQMYNYLVQHSDYPE